MKKILYLALICLGLNSYVFAADKTAVISRDTNLFAKPFKDAETLAELPTSTAIVILMRKGGWYQVKTAETQGWVRLTHVRLDRKANAKQDDGDNIGELLTGLATGREKSDQVTTATAVKGLSEEELRNAQPDIDALNALDNFAVDAQENEQSGLETRSRDYLDADGQVIKAKQAASTESEEEDL